MVEGAEGGREVDRSHLDNGGGTSEAQIKKRERNREVR